MAVLGLVLAGNVVLSTQANRAADAIRTHALHSIRVLDESEQLLDRVHEAEASQRGFLLTGHAAHLRPHDEAVQAARAHIAALEAATADSPEQRARIDATRTLVEQRFALLAEGIALTEQGRGDAATALVAGDEGFDLMQGIHAELAAHRDAEHARLARHDQDFATNRRRIRAVLWAEAAILLLMLPAFFLYARAVITRPIRRLTRDAEAMAAGAPRPDSLPAHAADELGRLAAAFDEMHATVSERTRALEAAANQQQETGRQLARALSDAEEQLSLAQRLRAELDEQQRFLTDLVGAVPAILYVYDLRTASNVFANDGISTLLGYSVQEIQEMGEALFPSLLHPDDIPAVMANQAALAAGADDETFEVEYRMRHKQGGYRRLLSIERVFRRDAAGAVSQKVGAVLDLTEQRAAEHALRERTLELERSNQDLEQFAYAASHDLQEPLRMVASYTQLLKQRYGGTLDDRADRYIGHAVDGALRMKRLIDELLAYSRITTRANAAADVDCAALLADVRQDLGVALADAEATLEVADLPTVHADGAQLRRVFQNLVANAIKFRGAAAPVVRVRATREAAGWCFSVADNGIGIAPEFQEQIFLVFQRLHARDAYPGSGMGLAIVKRIVERHGGEITVESAPGAGTTMRFTLPDPPGASG